MSIQTIYTFRPEDYEAITSLVRDHDWPTAFEDWNKRVTEQRGKFAARGGVVKEAVIDPEQFAAYCVASGIDRDVVALQAFAVKIARDQG